MIDHSANPNGERQEPSWFDRLAAKLGFAPSIDARAVIEEALADDEGLAFSVAERAMLQKALRFKNLRAEDMSLPRGSIVAVVDCAPLADLIGIFSRTGYSRVPVYHDTLDNPLGMVHVKDVIAGSLRASRGSLRPAVRAVSALPILPCRSPPRA